MRLGREVVARFSPSRYGSDTLAYVYAQDGQLLRGYPKGRREVGKKAFRDDIERALGT